jgi:hypothetical protein
MFTKYYFLPSIALLIFATVACGTSADIPPTPTQPPPTAQPTPIIQYFKTPSCLVFGGKVINKETGEWTNNRLILLFFKGKEIARAISYMSQRTIGLPPLSFWGNAETFTGSNGVEDGLFVLSAPNTYQLTISTLGIPPDKLSLFEGSYNDGYTGCTEGLVSWLYPFYEGETKEYFIPSKNIGYTLTVLSGDISQLPAEIQQPGSVSLLEGNRLVAVDPNAPEPTPQPAFSNSVTKFDQVVENTNTFPPAIFPINNCGGAADVKQEVTQTYIHEIIDETKEKLGIEIPIFDWIKIVAEIERHYGISDKQITTYSTTLTVPAGQNIQYTVIRKQTWESGMAIVVSGGVEVSAPYRILKSETFEVSNSEKKSCP